MVAVCVMEVEQRIQSICNVLGTQTFSLINQETRKYRNEYHILFLMHLQYDSLMIQSKSLYISHAVSNFFGTGIEIWAGWQY